MRALLQRVSEAEVKVEINRLGRQCGSTYPICAMAGDTQAEADQLISKITKLRIFKDDAGKMNKSIMDIGGSAWSLSVYIGR